MTALELLGVNERALDELLEDCRREQDELFNNFTRRLAAAVHIPITILLGGPP